MSNVVANTTNEKQPEVQQDENSLESRLSLLETDETSADQSSAQSEEVQTQVKEQSGLPSLEELELPETSEVKPSEKATDEKLDIPDTPEAKKFAEDFKQYLGFDIEELRGGMKELQQLRQEAIQIQQKAAQEREMNTLREEWGIDQGNFDERMKMIVQRFSAYPPEMQKRLDNIEGAKLIWAKLEQEQAKQPVPKFQKSTGKTSLGKQPMFTKSEIDSMSSSEYAKNADKILKAYRLGLVNLDA